jgi:hypothetical protein
MAMTPTPALPQTPKPYPSQIVNASGTGAVTAAAGGSNGTKLVALIATNTDSNAYVLQMSLVRGATTYLIGTVAIPAGAGSAAVTPAVNLMVSLTGLPVDSDGNPFLFLASGDTLAINTLSTVAASKALAVIGIGADF